MDPLQELEDKIAQEQALLRQLKKATAKQQERLDQLYGELLSLRALLNEAAKPKEAPAEQAQLPF